VALVAGGVVGVPHKGVSAGVRTVPTHP
jgi:hypothetical protein